MTKPLTTEQRRRIKELALRRADLARGTPREVVINTDRRGGVRVTLVYVNVK